MASTRAIRVSRYHEAMGAGGSQAFIGICADGVARVVKLQDNPQGTRVLVNEIVVTRLAALLGAPCPAGCLVEVPDQVLQDAASHQPQLASARSGLAFGCHWFDVQYGPGIDICKAALNREELIRLVTLYTWTRNSDLKSDHLLWRTMETGENVVMGFDHGHCFGGPGWNASIASQSSVSFSPARTTIDDAIELGDVEPALSQFNALTPDRVLEAVTNVPAEWGATASELDALGNYLVSSMPNATESVRNRFSPPGGAP